MNEPASSALDDPWFIGESDIHDAEIAAYLYDVERAQPASDLAAALNALEAASVRQQSLLAEQYRAIREILCDAASDPEPWCGPDPTRDPAWVDARRRSVAVVRRERREFAVRGAVADIATRLRLPEAVVRTRADHAESLRSRTPRVWASFLGGAVCEQNAITVAQLAASLPDDADTWAAFDARVWEPSTRLTPSKFRVSARAARERVHAESIDTRHRRAATDRRVWMTPELDGMATLSVLAPAGQITAAMHRVDEVARHLAAQADEGRTLAQLRADVLTDLLASGSTAATAPGPAVARAARVSVTIPVLSLLGESDEPATLDGYGPIDLDTARRLAGGAASWVRVLTHPVTGTVLDVDRRSYRVPADLRRWLGATHATCSFPGCARSARDCDLDHRVDWQHGGPTSAENLHPVCASHHRLKHESLWRPYRCPDTGTTTWVSPTGHETTEDPAPF